MNMPKIAIFIGTLLGVVGIVGAAHASANGKAMATALIPLYVGLVFEALGILSLLKPSWRKHLMHALAAIALLCCLGVGGRLASTWTRTTVSPIARGSQAAMTVLCAATVMLCVKSFRDARRARQLTA